MVYFAVRIRGQVGVRPGIKKALDLSGLRRKHTAVVFQETSSNLGMLRKAKDFITFGIGDKETLAALIEKRGRLEGDKRIDKAALKGMKLKDFAELADKIFSGAKLRDYGVKPFFRLHPPKGGFKGSIKRAVTNKGELGDRGEGINLLFKRMI